MEDMHYRLGVIIVADCVEPHRRTDDDGMYRIQKPNPPESVNDGDRMMRNEHSPDPSNQHFVRCGIVREYQIVQSRLEANKGG